MSRSQLHAERVYVSSRGTLTWQKVLYRVGVMGGVHDNLASLHDSPLHRASGEAMNAR